MKTFFKIFVLLSAMSCGEYALIAIKPPYTPRYDELTNQQKQQVEVLDKSVSICNLQNEGKVLAINAAQLSAYLAENDTSVLYVWSANCKSGTCILVEAAQEYCDTHDYNLFILSENYNLPVIEAQNKSHFPMLAANHEYYDTYRNDKRAKRFVKELMGKENPLSKTHQGRFLIFYKDELIAARHDLYNK